MIATVKIQVTQAKQKEEAPPPGFFKAVGKLAKNLKLLKKPRQGDHPPKQRTQETQPIPRTEDNPEGPVEHADVDWYGYGKEFKSTIYERTYPNLQQRFFEHGGLQLRLNQDFENLVDSVFLYYGDFGYIKSIEHKVGVSGEGGDGVKTFLDEAVYLKTNTDTFLALGKAPFSKNSEPSPYFQIYRTHPKRVQKGATHNVDYSRTVDGVLYKLEHIENVNELRPLLFRSLIKIIDSFPDDLRNQYQVMLESMIRYLESDPVQQLES